MSHPLANGLVYASVFNEGAGLPRNLVSRYPDKPSLVAGSYAWTPTPYGEGLNFPVTGADNSIDGGVQEGLNGASQFSAFVFLRTTNINGFGSATPVFYGDNSSYGWQFFWVCGGSGTDFTLGVNLTNVVALSTSSAITPKNSSGGTPVLNAPITMGFSFLGNNASGMKYYAYGAAQGAVSTSTFSAPLTGARGLGVGGTNSSHLCGHTILAVYVWNNIQPPETYAALNADPYQLIDFSIPTWLVGTSGGGAAYTLLATPGAYTLTGAAAKTVAARKLSGTPGAYALAGAAAKTVAARLVGASPGAYAITGDAALLKAARLVGASPGAYALIGDAALLKAARLVGASPGVYALTGDATLISRGYSFSAGAGAYALIGDAALVKAARKLLLASGAYTLTGAATLISRGYSFSAGAGVYSVAGNVATLKAARKLLLASGAYVVTGDPAKLSHGYVMRGAPGAYVLTGDAAALLAGRYLGVASGVYIITGRPAALIRGNRIIPVDPEYTVTLRPSRYVVVLHPSGYRIYYD